MKWSVLDQSPASAGSTQGAAIRESIALAQLCDELGYERYWVSEHHNSASIVGTAPEILIAAIAATTRRIRVGSAGVMLPHYSALKVAEQFRVLEAIAPGRIDLGVGRAPGSDGLTAHALNPHSNAAEDFPRQVQELQHWVSGIALPADHPYRSIMALPSGTSSPQLWILGSSAYGAQLAAHFGLPYAFAYFFSEGAGVDEALALYRRNYRPSDRYPKSCATICVWALAADTQNEARRLLLTLPVLVGILAVSFFFTHLTGDPTDVMLPPNTPEVAREAFRVAHGLDRPLGEQFLHFAVNAIRGDFGASLRFEQPAIWDQGRAGDEIVVEIFGTWLEAA